MARATGEFTIHCADLRTELTIFIPVPLNTSAVDHFVTPKQLSVPSPLAANAMECAFDERLFGFELTVVVESAPKAVRQSERKVSARNRIGQTLVLVKAKSSSHQPPHFLYSSLMKRDALKQYVSLRKSLESEKNQIETRLAAIYPSHAARTSFG